MKLSLQSASTVAEKEVGGFHMLHSRDANRQEKMIAK